MNTEKIYVGWFKRYILFHDVWPPKEMAGLIDTLRVKRPRRVPTVLTEEEVRRGRADTWESRDHPERYNSTRSEHSRSRVVRSATQAKN